ncbi:MAG: hypothetical protein BGO39_01750 [Chloroflexi bacterium 54-19]|nr:MAG: hypothetical protein BGO39_01750 [Chloroflexi bacterium 54-19]
MNSLYDSLLGHEDYGLETHKFYSHQSIYDNLYRVIAFFPPLLEYIQANSIKLVKWFKYLIILPELAGTLKILKATNPDVVICSHPFQTLTFQTLRQRLHLPFKIVSCICDYGDPQKYISYAPVVDHYLVRDEKTRRLALKYLPKQAQLISTFGVEAERAFENYHHRAEKETNIEREFNAYFKTLFGAKTAEFDRTQPSVLFIGGSGWVRRSEELIKLMAKSGKYNLLVVNGKDKALRYQLAPLKRVFCFDFINQDRLALVESFADVAVLSTIAPATLFELLTINKYPIFVHHFLAGNEEPHLELLSEWKVGFYEPDDHKMQQLIDQYLNNPCAYQEYKENGLKHCLEEKRKAQDNYKSIAKLLINESTPTRV